MAAGTETFEGSVKHYLIIDQILGRAAPGAWPGPERRTAWRRKSDGNPHRVSLANENDG
jgi:hypothetical protein